MFRGLSELNIDSKGRLAVPSRYRECLFVKESARSVLTLSPMDRSILLYPAAEWTLIESQLEKLSDSEKQSRRVKQMMRGHATDCHIDASGRILIPRKLRDYAEIQKQVVFSGQGNKFEIWNASEWEKQLEQWVQQVDQPTDLPETLKMLSL